MAEQSKFVECCKHLLIPGGSLFLSTINRSVLSYLLAIVAAENVAGLVPPGTHDWNKFPTPEEVTGMCSQVDLHVQTINGMVLNPLTDHWHLTEQAWTQVNFILHASSRG